MDTTIFAMLAVPITRARTLHLNYQVSSFLGVSLYCMNYMILPNKCVVIFRNKRQRVADLQESREGPQDGSQIYLIIKGATPLMTWALGLVIRIETLGHTVRGTVHT